MKFVSLSGVTMDSREWASIAFVHVYDKGMATFDAVAFTGKNDISLRLSDSDMEGYKYRSGHPSSNPI